MYVPLPRCRSCSKRISREWVLYMSLTRNDNDRNVEAIGVMIAHLYPQLIGASEETPYVQKLEDAMIAMNTDDESLFDARDTIRTAPAFPHALVCAALGITRTCCMVSLCDTAVVAVYTPSRPDGLNIITDTGMRRRIITRLEGASKVIKSNYERRHEHSIVQLFPRNAPRYSTGIGEDPLDYDTQNIVQNAIDDLADDL